MNHPSYTARVSHLQPQKQGFTVSWTERLHLDWPLLIGLIALIGIGLIVLYSAAQQDIRLLQKQCIHFGLGAVLLFICAQIPPEKYRLWTPWLFVFGVGLLLVVLLSGIVSKGAQRWLNLGILRFQPSEIMKLIVPLMIGWWLNRRRLPPSFASLLLASFWLGVPVLLIARQPDLGTALLVLASGCAVLFLAGIRWRLLISILTLAVISLPVLWYFMHSYQRQRVLTFLNPERDPLGSGYHIIQSKIALGSGGLFGKGWLNGTQSHLQFLPEHATDFIFAVAGEEFGLLGNALLIVIYLLIIARCLFLATQAQDNFSRLVIGGLTLSFFFAVFVNIGMVTGLLPVVGVPLPLISYGGSSVVTFMVGFGIIMSLAKHRRLLAG